MTPFHVYALDGFESAHRTLAAALRAARRGHRARGVGYMVVRADAFGFSGRGHGAVVATFGEVAS